jgi:hypothetical protein
MNDEFIQNFVEGNRVSGLSCDILRARLDLANVIIKKLQEEINGYKYDISILESTLSDNIKYNFKVDKLC